jgi:hypothetical protein
MGRTEPKVRCRAAEVAVERLEFAGILKEFGIPHYLKVDIEGADLPCIQALRTSTRCPTYFTRIHEDLLVGSVQ